MSTNAGVAADDAERVADKAAQPSGVASSQPHRGTAVPAAPVIATLAWRELARFFRQRNRVIGAFVQPVLFWLLFSSALGVEGAAGYTRFFPGTLAMIILFTAIFATISIIEDRNEGFLQGVLVAPIPRWAMVLGKVVGGASIAMIQAGVFLVLGWVTLADVAPTPLGAAAAVLLSACLAVALTGLGFLIAWRMDSTQGFHAIMSVFLLPMWFLSTAFFPQESGGVVGAVVHANPLSFAVAGLRHNLQPGDAVAGLPPYAACWAVTLAFAAMMLAACWWIAGTRSRGDFVS
ncbi:MAG: ABC transporter permease [Planctomycetota bacterium]